MMEEKFISLEKSSASSVAQGKQTDVVVGRKYTSETEI